MKHYYWEEDLRAEDLPTYLLVIVSRPDYYTDLICIIPIFGHFQLKFRFSDRNLFFPIFGWRGDQELSNGGSS